MDAQWGENAKIFEIIFEMTKWYYRSLNFDSYFQVVRRPITVKTHAIEHIVL